MAKKMKPEFAATEEARPSVTALEEVVVIPEPGAVSVPAPAPESPPARRKGGTAPRSKASTTGRSDGEGAAGEVRPAARKPRAQPRPRPTPEAPATPEAPPAAPEPGGVGRQAQATLEALREAENDLAEVKRQAQELKQELQDTRRQLPAIQQGFEEARTQVRDLLQQCQEAERQLQEARQKLTAARTEVQESKAQAREAGHELGQARQDLQEQREAAQAAAEPEPGVPRPRKLLCVTVADDAVVIGVVPDSPAEKVGLRGGDLITSVNGQPIANARELQHAIAPIGPGEEVTVTVSRGGEQKEVKAQLEEAVVAVPTA